MRNIVSRIVSALAIVIVAISVDSCTTARKDNVVGGHHEMLALGKQIQLATLPQKRSIEIPEAYPETEASKTILTANQTSGQDKCTFVFALDSTLNSIYSYNIRLKKWDNVNLPDNTPKVAFQDAAAIGSAHIAFISDTIDSVYFYHTITNTFISMGIPASDGAEPVIYDGKLYLINGVEGAFTLTELIIQKVRKGFTPVDSIVMVLYFLALILIGFYFSKRQKNSDDYFKGGQRIPWWAAGLSLFATALSAITFMSIPAKAYATDWSYMLFNAGIVFVCPIIIYLFIPFFRKLNISTAYEYLEVRFNYATRLICSLAFIIYQVGRMGVVLYLPAIAIHIVTGMNIFLCIALMGIFSIIYTRMGGIEAVVWTDALQSIILLGGALFCVIHIIHSSGLSFSETISAASSYGKFYLGSTKIDFTNATMWTVLIATFFTNLTTYGTDQSMVQRYLTTNSEKAARKSVLTNAIIVIPATILFFSIGTALFVYYKTNPVEASVAMENTDAIFPWYIYCNLPTGITGLLISGIFAAAMSTLSGSMNSAATAYVVDIRPRILKKISTDKKQELKVAKNATLVIGTLSLLFACLMATWNIDSLWDEFSKILGLILGSMGGLFLLGMVSKRANAKGALIGMAISVITQFIVAKYTPVYLLLYTTVGFIVCFAAGWIASLFFKN
ncbi:MAG: sodium:solute symporter [Rikenellaceae bacterium]|nr:sodium:solute symporter [Rikenellaceae bacterium]